MVSYFQPSTPTDMAVHVQGEEACGQLGGLLLGWPVQCSAQGKLCWSSCTTRLVLLHHPPGAPAPYT